MLPTILPIAISLLPLNAAVTDVTNSGSDVPKATIVRPINLSLNPAYLAIFDAASTEISDPTIIKAKPTRVVNMACQRITLDFFPFFVYLF